MKPPHTNALSLFCLPLLFLASLVGCASPSQKGVIRQSSALPDVKNRVLGITPDLNAPVFVYDKAPSPGVLSHVERIAKGTLYGAEQGAVRGVQFIAPLAYPFSALRQTALISLGLLATGAAAGGSIGMTYGPIKEGFAEDPAKADAALKQVVAELDIQNAIVAHLIESQQTHGGGISFIRQQDQQAIPGSLHAQLTTNIVGIGFLTDAQWVDPDPPLQLSLILETKLGLGANPDQVETNRYRYRSEPKRFREWGADEARAFREALDSAYTELSKAVLEDLRHSGNGPAIIFFFRQRVPGKAYEISVNGEAGLVLHDGACIPRSLQPSTTSIKIIDPSSIEPMQFDVFSGETYYLQLTQKIEERWTKAGTIKVYVPKIDLVRDEALVQSARADCTLTN